MAILGRFRALKSSRLGKNLQMQTKVHIQPDFSLLVMVLTDPIPIFFTPFPACTHAFVRESYLAL